MVLFTGFKNIYFIQTTVSNTIVNWLGIAAITFLTNRIAKATSKQCHGIKLGDIIQKKNLDKHYEQLT